MVDTCTDAQANSEPVGAAISALSAATPAASGTEVKPSNLSHAATAPAAALAAAARTAQMDLEEAGAESQPNPEAQLEPSPPEHEPEQARPNHACCPFYCQRHAQDLDACDV